MNTIQIRAPLAGHIFPVKMPWPEILHDIKGAVRFLLAWIIPAWVLLELAPTKLPHYVLPLYPALALLCGAAVMAGETV